MHGNELQLFGATPSHTINVTNVSEIAAVDTTFTVFSFDAVWAEHRASGTMLTMAEHRTNHIPVPTGCATC